MTKKVLNASSLEENIIKVTKFHYDLALKMYAAMAETGKFTLTALHKEFTYDDQDLCWAKTGKPAGTVLQDGRRLVTYAGLKVPAINIAFLLAFDAQAEGVVRPIDGNQANVARSNIIEIRPGDEGWVGDDESTGISWDKTRQKYVARIRHEGKRVVIGRYDDLEQAKAAYAAKAKELGKGQPQAKPVPVPAPAALTAAPKVEEEDSEIAGLSILDARGMRVPSPVTMQGVEGGPGITHVLAFCKLPRSRQGKYKLTDEEVTLLQFNGHLPYPGESARDFLFRVNPLERQRYEDMITENPAMAAEQDRERAQRLHREWKQQQGR